MVAYIISQKCFLTRINIFYFVFFFLLVNYFVNIPFFFIVPEDLAESYPLETLNNLDLSVQILLIIFLGPLFETLFFQYGIIKFLRWIVSDPVKNFYPAVLLSAVAFGVAHNYNEYYLVFGFLSGLLLAIAFYVAIYRKEPAFLTIFLIHSIWNSISLITD